MKKLLIALLLFAQVSVAQTVDIVVLGDGYKPADSALFNTHVKYIQDELFLRLWQRQSQIVFHPYTFRNKFQCTESTRHSGSVCNSQKVVSVANSSGISYDYILVLVKNQGGGGGGGICVVGMIYNDPYKNQGVHELSHTVFGLTHDGGIMNMSCNFGACAKLGTYTPSQFAQINQVLNQVAGAFSAPQPTIQILSPQNNYTTTTGGSLMAMAEVTGAVQYVEVIYDNILKGILPYWERNPNCNPTDGITFWINPLSQGQHTLTMKATDVNNQTAIQTITINVE